MRISQENNTDYGLPTNLPRAILVSHSFYCIIHAFIKASICGGFNVVCGDVWNYELLIWYKGRLYFHFQGFPWRLAQWHADKHHNVIIIYPALFIMVRDLQQRSAGL